MQYARRPERRHTVRVSLQVPLRIETRTPDGRTLIHRSSTLNLSANGALLDLDARVTPGEPLIVVNEMTSEAVQCYVTFVRERREGRGRVTPQRLVGVGFAFPHPHFWHIVFPKAGTRQATRAAKTGALVSNPN